MSSNNIKSKPLDPDYSFMPKLNSEDLEAISDNSLPQNIDHAAELKIAKRGLIIAFALGALSLIFGGIVEEKPSGQLAKSDNSQIKNQPPQIRLQ